MAASNNGASAAPPQGPAPAAAEQAAQGVAAGGAAGSGAVAGAAAQLAELQQLGRAEAEVEQVRTELSELRSLLIAQARLVQSQQQHIQQLQAAVGQAVTERATAAGSAAAAARDAVRSAAAEAAGAAAEAAAAVETTLAAPASPTPPPETADAAPAPPSATPSAEERLRGASPGRSALLDSMLAEEERARRAMQDAQLHDRRLTGLFDARYHSTAWGATPRDMRVLPKRIFLVRHAESEGNVDNIAYTYMPDARVPLTARGWQQAICAGDSLRREMDALEGGRPYKLFFYTSPYLRSRQTYEGLVQAFDPQQLKGVQEEVQLREQDFGNWQDAEGKKREKAERLRFGRFFYRFPNGESGADVYDRMTIFEDHLVRDINAGRFADNTSLVLVTHGLALRIFLMRWFHWTVDQFMCVFNPPNAQPLVLERVPSDTEARQGGPAAWIHTKALYRLSDTSREVIKGCTEEMCQTSWMPRQISPLDPADSMLLP